MPEMDEIRNLIRTGKLQEARTQLAGMVRDDPQNHAARNAYFESLCFQGDFERARKQLDALAALGTSKNPALDDHRSQALTDLYANAMTAEMARSEFYTQGRVPSMLRNPPENVRLRMRAALESRCGDLGRATECVRQAEELERPLTATMSGRELKGFRDADELLGPILEFHASSGDYHWIELELVRAIYPGPLKFWLNTLWRPATLLIEGSGPLNGLIPALYYGSSSSADEAIQLGRTTVWSGEEGSLQRGLGQREFMTDQEFLPALELETIEFPKSASDGTVTPNQET